MTAPQSSPAGRFSRALVGLHRTEQDAGLLEYVALLVRAGIVVDVVCIHVLPDAKTRDDSGEQVMAAMKADANRYLAALRDREIEHAANRAASRSTPRGRGEHQADVVLLGHRQDHHEAQPGAAARGSRRVRSGSSPTTRRR